MKLYSLSLALLAALALAAPAAAAPADYGTVNIISSSHQDTAWMDTPAYCRNFRIEKNIIPALEMMKKNPNYKFTMECMLHLMEFLEAHPERTNEIIELTRAGRFEWGATFNQPYESWLSGEELVRQLYYGRRWLKKNFPGCDTRVYFNPDVPARSLQMQQILARAGVPYMVGSRYTKGLYNWQSPDGSGIIFWTPGHYNRSLLMLSMPAPIAAWQINAELRRLGPYYLDRGIPPAYPLLNSNDFSTPSNFNGLIRFWNGPLSPWRITEGYQPPKMQYSSAAQFFDQIAAGKHLTLDRRLGERPDVWAYITGPTHEQTSSARRKGVVWLSVAETFSTIAGVLDGSFKFWPDQKFDQLWMDQIYIDHGIGGKNGHITDVVFHRKTDHIMVDGRSRTRIEEITPRIKMDVPGGQSITFFNPNPFPTDYPMTISLEDGRKRIFDVNRNEVLTQDLQNRPLGLNVIWLDFILDRVSSATASSSAGPDYGAEKAIDQEWEVAETHPELGPSQAWQSKPGPGSHWLAVDLGQPRTLNQVVIRHFGCIGKFGYETKLTTADFRVQWAETKDGPWADLVPPVFGNTLPLTVHSFAPKEIRFLRLFITRGTQAGGDGAARILELEAISDGPLSDMHYPPQELFLARDIPPFGYSTYIIAPEKSAVPPALNPSIKVTNDSAENSFYRISLAPGGVKSIYDKEQGRELLNTEKWLAGEVFTMLSVAPQDRLRGTDAGEFGSMPLPAMDGTFDRLANHKPEWKLVESGPVRAVWEATTQMADAEVRSRVMLWHGIKRINFDVDLINFNGRPWREWRMALPLGLDSPQLTYEVPMGVVRIGKDEIPGIGGYAYPTVTYTDEIKTIHPRQVQRWIDASDGRGGVTLSTSVSVFDWIDPTGTVPYPVIQPVLLASRKSCNIQGNWYPQAGDHHYSFSLTSHPGDWTQGWRSGIGGSGVVSTYIDPSEHSTSPAMIALPPSLSFFSLSAPNVLITAIKKAEDDDEVVVRMVEMEGKDTEVTLKTHFRIEAAARTNIIEEDPQPIPAGEHEVTLKIGHNAIETIKLRMK